MKYDVQRVRNMKAPPDPKHVTRYAIFRDGSPIHFLPKECESVEMGREFLAWFGRSPAGLSPSSVAEYFAQFLKLRETKPDDPRWEACTAIDDDNNIYGYKVRWSEPDKGGKYLWVGHYHCGEIHSLSWCRHTAERDAEDKNKAGKSPWEYREYRVDKPEPAAETEEATGKSRLGCERNSHEDDGHLLEETL